MIVSERGSRFPIVVMDSDLVNAVAHMSDVDIKLSTRPTLARVQTSHAIRSDLL